MDRRDFLRTLSFAGAAAAASPLLGEFFIPWSEAAALPGFSFVHITDLHLDVQGTNSWQYREKSVPLFIDTLRQVGRLPELAFVLFGGDQVQSGPRDRESLVVFQQWVRQLDVPVYMLLGDSEASPAVGGKLAKADYLAAWKGRGLAPLRTSWTVDPVKGVRIIGFDVTVDGMPYGHATPERLQWLERELQNAKKKELVVVATHQLLLPTCPMDRQPEGALWMVRNHAAVRDLLARYPNVRLALAGHHHCAKVDTLGRTTYVATPAVVTYPCAFRLFTVDRDGIAIRTVGIDARALVERAQELLAEDPYARLYDETDPRNVIAFSNGLAEQDRQTTVPL